MAAIRDPAGTKDTSIVARERDRHPKRPGWTMRRMAETETDELSSFTVRR